MIDPKEIAQRIVNGLVKSDKQLIPDDIDFVLGQLHYAINAERWECVEAIKHVANDMHTDDEGEYKGYKAGIVASIAAIRARKEHSA